jgi:hypothetical protein
MRSGAGARRRRRGRQPRGGRHAPGSRRRRRRSRCVRSGIGARSRVAMLAAVLPAAPLLPMLQPGISMAASRDRHRASSGTRRSTTRARSSLSAMATSARSRSRLSRSITASSRPEGDALGARSCRARRFVSPLPVRAEGHDSTVSRCATGSNPRNPQSQRCGPRGARTRTVWYDARSAAGKGIRVLGRSRWDCGLRRCEARRWASGIRSRNASGSDVNSSGRSSTAGSPSRATSTSAPSSTVNAGAEKAGNPGTQGLVPVASVACGVVAALAHVSTPSTTSADAWPYRLGWEGLTDTERRHSGDGVTGPDEPGDRDTRVPVPSHGGLSPAQGVPLAGVNSRVALAAAVTSRTQDAPPPVPHAFN